MFFDQAACFARAQLALVRIDAGERDHDVGVLLRELGNLLIGDAAPADIGLAIHREHHEADVALAVVLDRFGNRGSASLLEHRAEVFVGGLVEFFREEIGGWQHETSARTCVSMATS